MTMSAADVPDEYIYFDLDAGSITIGSSNTKYTGYVYVNGTSTEVTGTVKTGSKFYIYQSSRTSGSEWGTANTGYATTEDFKNRQNIRIPQYPELMVGDKTWSQFIKDNSDCASVINAWGPATEAAKRSVTPYSDSSTKNLRRIRVNCSSKLTFEITIDNLNPGNKRYSTSTEASGFKNVDGPFQIEGGNCNVTLKLKGDSRLSSLHYYDMTGSDRTYQGGSLTITSADGDGSNSGSLTVAPYDTDFKANNYYAIGGAYSNNDPSPAAGNIQKLTFAGGTVFAGTPGLNGNVWTASGCVSNAIGSRRVSTINITGGTVTAVANTTGAAIGGGGGYTNDGGKATVTISGGDVYAYNHGIYVKDTGNKINTFIPCVAIGSGSSANSDGEGSTITITGGNVYAQSAGGVAIGGGGSATGLGGAATVTISGGNVTAKSTSGRLKDNDSYSYNASCAIGGGTGYTGGGSATITISGSPVINAGSVGGGGVLKGSKSKIGTAQITIQGNPSISAQFVLAKGSATAPSFSMSGGTIHDSSTSDAIYEKFKPDGGALYLEEGTVEITGGTITKCSANNGGAIFVSGNDATTLNISGSASLTYNTATENGGCAYAIGGTTTVAGATIANNSAVNGGAFYLDKSTVTSGKTTTTYYPKVKLQSGDLHNNTASASGGFLYMEDGYASIGTSSTSDIARIYGNTAEVSGGGFYIGNCRTNSSDFKAFNILNAKIGLDGGANDNRAETDGGAFYIGGGTIHLEGCEVVNNTAVNGNGGSFYTLGDMEINSTTISDNTAGTSGGGFYVSGGNVSIDGSTISSNHAKTYGGGLYLRSDGESTSVKFNEKSQANPSFVTGNDARCGAGIYVDGGSITMAKGTTEVSHNTASEYGGGFYVNDGVLISTSVDAQGTPQAKVVKNSAGYDGGGAYISGGSITFMGNISDNIAKDGNGGGIYLAGGAQMDFQGGIISGNRAKAYVLPVRPTAYAQYTGAGSEFPVKGCGGGIYLQKGISSEDSKLTKLDINLSDGAGHLRPFGLYSNSADKGGDDIVSEGLYTDVELPSVANMELVGFEGQDANPHWYQDYFVDDPGYDKTKQNPNVNKVTRFREMTNGMGAEYRNHLIKDTSLAGIAGNYLCLTLGFEMINITLTATGLAGKECALFRLLRLNKNDDNEVVDEYNIILAGNGDGSSVSKTIVNLPWGKYSIIPVNEWNWAYEPLESREKVRLSDTWEHTFVFNMNHIKNAEVPLHDEKHTKPLVTNDDSTEE